jgi:circadian clock protein KaiC
LFYFAFEESESQLMRNMRSIGLDMAKWTRKSLLQVHASRPELQGLERHLVEMHKLIREFEPQAVVVDPVTNLIKVGDRLEVTSMLTRLVDNLKMENITSLFTSLVTDAGGAEAAAGVSSLMDTWINLEDILSNGERNRGIMIMKSRGMGHSNQVRKFKLTDRGVVIADAYLGPSGILTGSARETHEAQERAALTEQKNELKRKKREIERKRKLMQAKIEELKAGFEVDKEEMERIASEGREKDAAERGTANGHGAHAKSGLKEDEMKGTATGKPSREANNVRKAGGEREEARELSSTLQPDAESLAAFANLKEI